MTALPRVARAVNWFGYLAFTLLLLIPTAVMTVRAGAWQQGLLLYSLACIGSALLLVTGTIMLMLPRFATARNKIGKRLLATLPGSLLAFAILAGGGDHPGIHDISTDTDDPPLFVEAPAQRGEYTNSLDLDPIAMTTQQQAYPEIQTLRSDLGIDAAFDRALSVAEAMDWRVYHRDRNAGIIEAEAATAIMAFKDDVVVRVQSDEAGSLIDLRSVSRVGVGDMGANAKRIREFGQRFLRHDNDAGADDQ